MSDYNNDNGNNGDQNSEYKEPFINDLRNRLVGKRLHGASGDPTLTPSWYENNLGFAVKTNVPDDTNDGKIRFGSDNNTSSAALRCLIGLATGDPFFNDGRSQNEDIVYGFTRDLPEFNDKPRKLINKLVVGRKNGRYFIGVIEENRPQPIFFFGLSDHHTMEKDGQRVSPEVESAHVAINWASNLGAAIPNLQEAYYETISTLMQRWQEKKGNKGKGFKKGNGQGGYGGKKQWNNNNGYQKKGGYNGNGNGYNGKKQWNNNGNGNGYQKKQWNNNNGGGNNGYNGGGQGGSQSNDFDDNIPF